MLLQLSVLTVQAGKQPHQPRTQRQEVGPGQQGKGGGTCKELSECQLLAPDHFGRR